MNIALDHTQDPPSLEALESHISRAAHVRCLRIVADHLEGEIGPHAGAHVERACVNERPAAMIALNTPKIDSDQALKVEIGLFAAEMAKEDVFGWDCRIGLEFEAPMTVVVLSSQQRFRRARDMTLQRLRRQRILSMIEGDIHCERLITQRLGASAPDRRTIEAAL